MTRLQTSVLFVFIVAAFAVLAWRTEAQQRQIRDAQVQIVVNQQRITRLQFEQCSTRNEGTRRQNALIDSAIAAEQRKAAPDRQRVHDLSEFKSELLDCGPRPAG